jgi:hypothetical protein
MKVIKTSIHRLTIEKDCGCKATREYEDQLYKKPIAEGKFIGCEKHSRGAVAEFAGEMLIESLNKEAEAAKLTYAPLRQEVEEGDSGGVTATGESVQRLGVTGLPERKVGTNPPRHRDPLAITKVSVDRPAPKTAAAIAAAGYDPLPQSEIIKTQEGIEVSTEIGVEAPEDPNLSNFVEDTLGRLDFLDQDDAKAQGVAQRFMNEAE